MCNEEWHDADENTRYNVEMDVLAMTQEQYANESTEAAHGQFAQEENEVTDTVDGGHL